MKNRILIKNVSIIDGINTRMIQGKSILVSNGRIEKIADSISEAEDMLIIEGQEKYVMPGMIDCHIHIDLGGDIAFPDSILEESLPMFVIRAMDRLSRYLPAGFTTVRINGGIEHLATSLRDSVKSGLVNGPRIIAAGRYLSITSGHGEFFQPWVNAGEHMVKFVNGPEEVRKAVREQVLDKVDMIKFFNTGGVSDPNSNPLVQEFTDEEIAMLVYEAKRVFKRTSTHAHGIGGIKSAVKGGVDSIEHCSMLDEECAKLMKEKGTFMVPTLKASYSIMQNKDSLPDYVVEKCTELVQSVENSFKLAYDEGVNISMGTDTGTPFSMHGENAKEFELMVNFGMSEMDAIISGTRKAAENLGIEELTGTIEEGKWADLLILDANPLEDISVLQDKKKILVVMKEGKVEVRRF